MNLLFIYLIIIQPIYAISVKEVVKFKTVCLELGTNLGEHVMHRVITHLKSTAPLLHIEKLCPPKETMPEDSLILSIGNSTHSLLLIPNEELQILPFESFQIRGKVYEDNKVILGCNGRPLDPHRHRNITFNKETVHYGAVVSAYACLELLGYAFLHPLSAYTPSVLQINISQSLEIVESPYWPSRIFHIHTQHPLELTEVLQGMDIPMFGHIGPHCENPTYSNGAHNDKDKGTYCERWEDMVSEVDRFFEWSVANRLNAVEWLLLGNFKWGDFDTSDTRQKRLRVLAGLGHAYSLLVGADAPLGNIQQHAWYMVNIRLPFEEQVKQIHARVDWIFSAGFDFLSTESGLSEFTHPECDLMLDLLNVYASYVNGTWGREAAVKVHCSTGQTCEQYADPRTGEPVNFNFLPMFAVPQLGVLPHTVQMYGLKDPTAGSYGNADFSYIEDYMFLEAETGNRSVVYYGETSYWVNVDIDVPLFLPIYGQRRMKDLQRIARREVRSRHRIEGQMNFDSGWEWGYWLNDFVTARASWDPFPGGFGKPVLKEKGDTALPTDRSSMDELKPIINEDDLHEWDSFAAAILPMTKIFGVQLGAQLEAALLRLSKAQVDLLILGRVDGQPCPNPAKLTGIAYMSGTDTWVDLPRSLGVAFTQADKIHMDESDDPQWPLVAPLLEAMERDFLRSANEITSLYELAKAKPQGSSTCLEETQNCLLMDLEPNLLNEAALEILSELVDSTRILALRASQIRMLYASSDTNTPPALKAQLQTQSRSLLSDAATVVARRELAYRVPWQRIAGWRDNPTVYRFGYLWSVHSLYYWWRDQGLAEQGSLQSERSPCYLNRMDASEVAVGWGKYTLELLRNVVHRYMPFLSGYSAFEFLNCIAPPAKEYLFPQDLYHY